MADAGFYTCKAMNPAGNQSKTFYLKVSSKLMHFLLSISSFSFHLFHSLYDFMTLVQAAFSAKYVL